MKRRKKKKLAPLNSYEKQRKTTYFSSDEIFIAGKNLLIS